MAHPTGSWTLGPADATLLIRTGRTGPAAKAGHDLDIRVARWSARLALTDDPGSSTLDLEADSRSLEVLRAADAPDALGERDKAKIASTINEHIFRGREISFHATGMREGSDGVLMVTGELNLLGTPGPIEFALAISADGHLTGRATVRQTAFGLTPHAALMGALRLADDVELSIEGRLPGS